MDYEFENEMGDAQDTGAQAEPHGEESGYGYTLPDSGGGTPGGGAASAAELDSRIDAIAKQLTPELRQTARHRYDALLEERGRLYAARYPEPEAEEGSTQAQTQTEAPSLHQQAAVELAKLKALGFDGKPPQTIEERHVQAWTQQRLCAEKNFDELAPLLRNDLTALEQPPEIIQAFDAFMRGAAFDDELRNDITEVIIKRLYELKGLKKKG